MKKVYFAAFILTFVLLGVSTSAQAQQGGRGGEPGGAFVLLSPRNGDVFRAGEQVKVRWDLELDRDFAENPFAEMEFLLVTDEGVSMRITRQMGVRKRVFNWTVPSIGTSTARLVLRCGIEGSGDSYRFEQTGTFTIRTTRHAPIVRLNPLREDIKPGEDLEISWTSNLKGNVTYDVMVSYDQGAHFHKAGSTTENAYIFKVDDDFDGSITVQIIAHREGGSRVKSNLTPDTTVRVTDGDNR